MKKKIAYGAVLLATAVFISGCATMFTEKTQNISFKSKPVGAEVVVGSKTCTTPCNIELDKRKWNAQALVSKPGYDPQTLFLVPSIEPWVFANVLNFGFGGVVDVVTGAYKKYQDDEYYVPLTKR